MSAKESNTKGEDDKKQPGFTDRNVIIKTYKISGKFGWMHLVLAQRKADGKRFLRLKRYMNWFSIPDNRMLSAVQKMLNKGANELGWAYDKTKDVVIQEVNEPDAPEAKAKHRGEIDEDL